MDVSDEIEIVKITDVPAWMIKNNNILTGYRKNCDNLKKILKSVVIKHNELMNIWTHFVAIIIFIGFMVALASSPSYGKFKANPFKSSFEEMQKNTSEFIGKFLKIKDMDVSDSKSEGDNQSNVFIGEYLTKSKSYLQNMKQSFNKIVLQLERNLKQKELVFLQKFGRHYDESITKLDEIQKHLQTRSSDLRLSENQESLEEDSSYIEIAIDKLLQTFDKILPDEKLFSKFLNQFEPELEVYPFFIFLTSAIFCLLCSIIYHWFFPMSKTICKILHRLDLAGISILNFGSMIGVYYYFFYCMPTLQFIYCFASFVSCFTVFVISMQEFIHNPKFHKLRSIMYGGLGLSNVIPLTHLIILSMKSAPSNDYIPLNFCFLWLILEGVFYLGGLTIFTFRFPERYYPKTFDIWLNSHSIWHVCVFLGAFSHFYSMILLYKTRLQNPCLL